MRTGIIVLICSLLIGCMTSVNHLIAPEYTPTHISTKSSAKQRIVPRDLPIHISTKSSTNQRIAPKPKMPFTTRKHSINDEVQRLLPPSDWLEKLPRKDFRRWLRLLSYCSAACWWAASHRQTIRLHLNAYQRKSLSSKRLKRKFNVYSALQIGYRNSPIQIEAMNAGVTGGLVVATSTRSMPYWKWDLWHLELRQTHQEHNCMVLP